MDAPELKPGERRVRGILTFNYPVGNAAAKRVQEANAGLIRGDVLVLLCARDPGNWPAVEQVVGDFVVVNPPTADAPLHPCVTEPMPTFRVGDTVQFAKNDEVGEYGKVVELHTNPDRVSVEYPDGRIYSARPNNLRLHPNNAFRGDPQS